MAVLGLAVAAVAGIGARVTADDQRPGWLCVVNGTDHHEIHVFIDGHDRGEVPALEGRVFRLAPHEYPSRCGTTRVTGRTTSTSTSTRARSRSA